MKKAMILFGLVAVGLISCQPAPKLESSTSQRILGTLEVSFGAENGRAKATFSPSRIAGQALVNEAQLSFTPSTYSTAVQTTPNAKWLNAKFTVRNLTGAPLNNLTFVAYRKNGNIGNTALKSVTNFGNGNISTYAQNIRPSQAMSGNGTVAVVAGQEDLALFTEFDLNALTDAAGTALDSGEYLLPYGFTVRNLATPTGNTQRNIPANVNADTGTVTLAMGVDGSNEPILPTPPTAYRFSFTALVFENPNPRPRVSASLEELTSSAVETRQNDLGGLNVNEIATVYSSVQNDLARAYSPRPGEYFYNACQVRIAGTSTTPQAFLESTAPSIASSTPDLCFAGAGVQRVTSADQSTNTDLTRLSDGRIAIVGQYDPSGISSGSYVGLYFPDGTPRTLFPRASNAMAITLGNTYYTSIAVDSQDRIIRAGYSVALTGETNLVIGRSLPDTNLSNDTTFSSTETRNTQIYTATGSEHVINDIALQPDGKIVAVGRVKNGTAGNNDVVVLRYNTDGTLDTTFNTTGYRIDDVDGTGSDNQAMAVAIDATGKIVLVGRHDTGIFLIMRLNSNGTRDTSFFTSGARFYGVSGTIGGDVATSLTFQGTKILVAGYTNPNANFTSVAALRFNADGTLDTGFGTSGELIFAPAGFSRARANKVLMQADGKFILTGTYTATGGVLSAFVARYLTNGALDNNFNSTSHARVYRFNTTTTFETASNSALIIPSATDTKLVIAGLFGNNVAVSNRRGMLAQINLGAVSSGSN